MKSLPRKLIFLVIIAVTLLISNPDLKKHQDKIIEKYNQANPLTGALGAGEIVRQVVAYKSYYFWSVGKISVTNESVSFGIAGFVFVYGNLDLMKYKDKLPDFKK
jgi:hypothetical protein